MQQHRIHVVKTFIEVIDIGDPPPLTRAKTVPTTPHRYEDYDHDDAEDEGLQTDGSGETTDAAVGALSGDAPMPQSITRYEDTDDEWADESVVPTAPTRSTSQDLGQMNSMSMQPQMMAQPMMYQVPMGGAPMPGMPVMMMQPVMIPVMPGGYQQPAAPVAESSPGSGSSPGRSPGASPNARPPPPPQMAPSIERVSSTLAGQAPELSPQMGKGKSPALLASYADGDNTTKSEATAASASAPVASAAPVLAAPATAPAPQPQTLTRAFSMYSGTYRFHWHVPAHKLRRTDKQIVSPPFELSCGSEFPDVTFKMMIYPNVTNDAKGGASFKKAQGKGFVHLKCEAELSEAVDQVKFRIGIGSGSLAQVPRGPMSHNFSQKADCRYSTSPQGGEEFDFRAAIDADSMTLLILLEIVPAAG